jgi:hypothetical protein
VCGGSCVCAPGNQKPCGHCLDGTETCNASGQWGACIGGTPSGDPCP